MKKQVLITLLAFTLISFTSCLKEYTCDCPPGTTAKMSAATKKEAKTGCEASTNGVCTLN